MRGDSIPTPDFLKPLIEGWWDPSPLPRLREAAEAGVTVAHVVRINRRPGWAVDYSTTSGLGLFYHIGCPQARWGISSCPCGARVPDPNAPRLVSR
jgi:hypothetical protein